MAEQTGKPVNVSGGDNKKLYMILGIAAVAGLAIWFMRKPKPEATPGHTGGGLQRVGGDVDLDMPDSDDIDTDDYEEEEEVQPELTNCIRMGPLHDNWVGIQSRSRAAANNIYAGTPIKIKNTTQGLDGNYTVISTWIDANGNVGALDLETNYTPILTDGPDNQGGLSRDYRFDGEGLICT